VDTQNNSGNPTGYDYPQAALNADQYTSASPWYNRTFDAIKADDTSPQHELLRQILEGDLPAEELYDLDTDLWCTHNLANNPVYDSVKAQLRAELTAWRIRTDDYNRDPSEVTRRTERHRPLPGTLSTVTESDDFNIGSGILGTQTDWTTLVFGNSAADFTLNSGSVNAPAGPAPLTRYNAANLLAGDTPFTVSVDVGFSSIGVGAGVAFGIEQEADLEYSYWQFLLIDGRSGPASDKDVRLRKMRNNGSSNDGWAITVDDRANYPNGFNPAPTEFFRIKVCGRAGSSLVDLRIYNPDGSVYYSVNSFDLGEPVPAGSAFGITTWSSGSAVFEDFELGLN
jgi:hypothetical protein